MYIYEYTCKCSAFASMISPGPKRMYVQTVINK